MKSFWAQEILKQTQMQNGESDVSVYSVIAHETATGYAQCFADDVANEQMGKLHVERLSLAIKLVPSGTTRAICQIDPR